MCTLNFPGYLLCLKSALKIFPHPPLLHVSITLLCIYQYPHTQKGFETAINNYVKYTEAT